MSLATKAATCASCGKRLNRKRWYYRNGQYFCKKHCWVTEHEKAAQEAAKAAPAKEEAASADKKQAPAQQDKPTPEASSTAPPAA